MEENKQQHPDNMRIYQQGRDVPQTALKTIGAGRLKGMSDVNPMWRIKRCTEIFGPCGIGWYYTIDRQWEQTYGQEVKCFCNVSLYIKDAINGEWSKPIPGCGGSAIVSVERSGLYVNDEGYKMALTDALSIAMKALGIGADVWYGKDAKGHNESKYEEPTNAKASQPFTQFDAAVLQAAMKRILAADTTTELAAVYNEYTTLRDCTEFMNALSARKKDIKNNVA